MRTDIWRASAPTTFSAQAHRQHPARKRTDRHGAQAHRQQSARKRTDDIQRASAPTTLSAQAHRQHPARKRTDITWRASAPTRHGAQAHRVLHSTLERTDSTWRANAPKNDWRAKNKHMSTTDGLRKSREAGKRGAHTHRCYIPKRVWRAGTPHSLAHMLTSPRAFSANIFAICVAKKTIGGGRPKAAARRPHRPYRRLSFSFVPERLLRNVL